MTRKRFQKLCRSEMTKLMAHNDGAGKCIKVAANTTIRNFQKPMTYQECWTMLNKAFTYPGNTPPIK